mgnify:FL=1
MRQRKVNWSRVYAAILFFAWAMFFFSLIIPDSLGPIQYVIAAVLALIAIVGMAVLTSGSTSGKQLDRHIDNHFS